MKKQDSVKLRPYQEKFIEDINEKYDSGIQRVVGVAPCGSGKTIMAAKMIQDALDNNKRTIFFVHRNELIEQTSRTLKTMNIEHGIIASGTSTDLDKPVQIASVQTLYRRLDKVPTPDFLICDECHHILASSYLKILSHWNKARLLGLTATPERTGGIRLGDVFSSMVIGPTVKELIDIGNLASFKYISSNVSVDTTTLDIKYGDYDNLEAEKAMSSKRIIGGIVDNYLEYSNGKSAICYCVNINHSIRVCNSFLEKGITAAQCDGETPKNIRNQIVEDFRLGKIKVLCNAELFGEGFDVPNMDTVILARPTQSLTLYVQQSMRPLRPNPNDPSKQAIIIDHVKNYTRFGLPDEQREWGLINIQKPVEKRTFEEKYKECPECHAILASNTRICPDCGFQFSVDMEEDGSRSSGELLKEIYTSSKHLLKIEDFVKIAKEKNYKLSWAAYKALDYAQSLEDCRHIAEVIGYKQGWAWYKWNEIQIARNAQQQLCH